ncbi:hypothetical protein BKA69DRAFT_1087095, partial [Paraphysoderma sedebokerense]
SLNWTVPYIHSLPVYYLKSHHEKLTCVKLEQSVLATCGYDRTVRVWLWNKGGPKIWRLWWKYSVDFVASCIDFVSKNGKLIIAPSPDLFPLYSNTGPSSFAFVQSSS